MKNCKCRTDGQKVWIDENENIICKRCDGLIFVKPREMGGNDRESSTSYKSFSFYPLISGYSKNNGGRKCQKK